MILLRSFALDDGSDVVGAWYRRYAAEPRVRAKLDMRMVHLRCRPRDARDGWCRPYYDTLDGGVGEVRFEVGNVQHRPIGFFGPGRNEFTFLVFAIEQSDRLYPKNAVDMAIDRKRRVEANPALSIIVTGRWHQ